MEEPQQPGAPAAPRLSVVVTTHDRPDGVERAVASVLAQVRATSIEVVVVDDGSAPANARRLDELAGGVVRVLHQPDLGLSAARSTGVAAARGEWIAFLDDDDTWLPGWSASLSPLMESADVGVVSGAAQLVDPDGTVRSVEPPRRLGPIFTGVTAQFLAGCFAVRRELYDAAGGYLPGLSCSHQTELFIRLGACLVETGMRAAWIDEPVAAIERRAAGDRSFGDPRMLYDGTRWVLARHGGRFALDRDERSNWEAVATVNAARSGDRAGARRWALRSLRDTPTRRAAWLRVAVALTPPLARRVWGTVGPSRSASPAHRAPLAHAARLATGSGFGSDVGETGLFLPWRYQQGVGTPNRPARAETRELGVPRTPVERWAVRRGRRLGARTLVTVAAVGRGEPGPTILEDADDPRAVLGELRDRVDPGGLGLVVATDRSSRDASGPPQADGRRREWSRDELELLLESVGLQAVAVRRRGSAMATSRRSGRIVRRVLRGGSDGRRPDVVAFLVRPDPGWQ